MKRRRLMTVEDGKYRIMISCQVEDNTKDYEIFLCNSAGLSLSGDKILIATIEAGQSSTGVIYITYDDDGLLVNNGKPPMNEPTATVAIGDMVYIHARYKVTSEGSYAGLTPENNKTITLSAVYEDPTTSTPHMFNFPAPSGGSGSTTTKWVSFYTTQDVNVKAFKSSHGNGSTALSYVSGAPYVSRTTGSNGKYIFSIPVSDDKITVNTISGNLTTTDVSVGSTIILYVYDNTGNFNTISQVTTSYTSGTKFDSNTTVNF